jgi:excisionase family DNA binding protein
MAKVKRRSYNPRRVCRDLSYSVQEVAELFGIHKNTVLQWLKNGLVRIDDSKPYLIHGSNLMAFLDMKRESRKSRCKDNELYCFRCRAPRRAWENTVDIVFINSKKLRLEGLCSVCDAKVLRMGSPSRMAEYLKNFSIQEQVNRHIVESKDSSLNSD